MSIPPYIDAADRAASQGVTLAYLADTPDLIPQVAAWQFAEWSNYPGARTLEERQVRLQAHLQREAIPTTFVAWEADQPIGIASLVANDLDELPEWIPWLASVYVVPEKRRRGIGSRLVERVAAEAVTLGYPRLYLFTPDQMHLYATLGWQVSHVRTYRQRAMTVMTRDLIVHPPHFPVRESLASRHTS